MVRRSSSGPTDKLQANPELGIVFTDETMEDVVSNGTEFFECALLGTGDPLGVDKEVKAEVDPCDPLEDSKPSIEEICGVQRNVGSTVTKRAGTENLGPISMCSVSKSGLRTPSQQLYTGPEPEATYCDRPQQEMTDEVETDCLLYLEDTFSLRASPQSSLGDQSKGLPALNVMDSLPNQRDESVNSLSGETCEASRDTVLLREASQVAESSPSRTPDKTSKPRKEKPRKSIKCPVCNDLVPSADWSEHINSHGKESNLGCRTCLSSRRCPRHGAVTAPQEKFPCTECSFVAEDTTQLSEHLEEHENESSQREVAQAENQSSLNPGIAQATLAPVIPALPQLVTPSVTSLMKSAPGYSHTTAASVSSFPTATPASMSTSTPISSFPAAKALYSLTTATPMLSLANLAPMSSVITAKSFASSPTAAPMVSFSSAASMSSLPTAVPMSSFPDLTSSTALGPVSTAIISVTTGTLISPAAAPAPIYSTASMINSPLPTMVNVSVASGTPGTSLRHIAPTASSPLATTARTTALLFPTSRENSTPVVIDLEPDDDDESELPLNQPWDPSLDTLGQNSSIVHLERLSLNPVSPRLLQTYSSTSSANNSSSQKHMASKDIFLQRNHYFGFSQRPNMSDTRYSGTQNVGSNTKSSIAAVSSADTVSSADIQVRSSYQICQYPISDKNQSQQTVSYSRHCELSQRSNQSLCVPIQDKTKYPSNQRVLLTSSNQDMTLPSLSQRNNQSLHVPTQDKTEQGNSRQLLTQMVPSEVQAPVSMNVIRVTVSSETTALSHVQPTIQSSTVRLERLSPPSNQVMKLPSHCSDQSKGIPSALSSNQTTSMSSLHPSNQVVLQTSSQPSNRVMNMPLLHSSNQDTRLPPLHTSNEMTMPPLPHQSNHLPRLPAPHLSNQSTGPIVNQRDFVHPAQAISSAQVPARPPIPVTYPPCHSDQNPHVSELPVSTQHSLTAALSHGPQNICQMTPNLLSRTLLTHTTTLGLNRAHPNATLSSLSSDRSESEPSPNSVPLIKSTPLSATSVQVGSGPTNRCVAIPLQTPNSNPNSESFRRASVIKENYSASQKTDLSSSNAAGHPTSHLSTEAQDTVPECNLSDVSNSVSALSNNSTAVIDIAEGSDDPDDPDFNFSDAMEDLSDNEIRRRMRRARNKHRPKIEKLYEIEPDYVPPPRANLKLMLPESVLQKIPNLDYSGRTGRLNQDNPDINSPTSDNGCKVCGLKFVTLDRFNEHRNERLSKLICCKCSYHTPYKSRLRRHTVIHTQPKPYKCDVCDMSLKTRDSYILHILWHNKAFPYKCSECDAGFMNYPHYEGHLNKHLDRMPYKCLKCETLFSSTYTLHRHMFEKHRAKKEMECHICKAILKSKKTLTQHLLSHRGAKHLCEICGRAYTHQPSLAKHRLLHSDEAPQHMCEYCGRTFRKRTNLRLHERKHTGERPYVCDVCGKAFSFQSPLKYHMRIHTGERPYKCNICSMTFAQPSPFAVHKRLHSGETPYKCKICPKAFPSHAAVRNHMLTHGNAENTSKRKRKAEAKDQVVEDKESRSKKNSLSHKTTEGRRRKKRKTVSSSSDDEREANNETEASLLSFLPSNSSRRSRRTRSIKTYKESDESDGESDEDNEEYDGGDAEDSAVKDREDAEDSNEGKKDAENSNEEKKDAEDSKEETKDAEDSNEGKKDVENNDDEEDVEDNETELKEEGNGEGQEKAGQKGTGKGIHDAGGGADNNWRGRESSLKTAEELGAEDRNGRRKENE